MHGTVAPIVASCAQTIVGKVVDELHTLYSEIDEKQKKWLRAAPQFNCPSGCGCCCHSFEPDVLECEALYMASWFLLNDRDRAVEIATLESIPRLTDFPSGCPLQIGKNGIGSCGVYGGRALVCRLFGYCGDTGRDGKVRFRTCKYHPLSLLNQKPRDYSEVQLYAAFSHVPPIMSDFGSQAIRLAGQGSAQTELLSIALPRALRKILMLENLHRSALLAEAISISQSNDNNGGDNDTPNPSPTLPKAG